MILIPAKTSLENKPDTSEVSKTCRSSPEGATTSPMSKSKPSAGKNNPSTFKANNPREQSRGKQQATPLGQAKQPKDANKTNLAQGQGHATA